LEDAQDVISSVRRAAAGDSLAWETLCIASTGRGIYNICYRFFGSGEHADDLPRKFSSRCTRTLSTYDVERGAFMTWVTTITRQPLVDHFRKSKQDRATDSIDAEPRPTKTA